MSPSITASQERKGGISTRRTGAGVLQPWKVTDFGAGGSARPVQGTHGDPTSLSMRQQITARQIRYIKRLWNVVKILFCCPRGYSYWQDEALPTTEPNLPVSHKSTLILKYSRTNRSVSEMPSTGDGRADSHAWSLSHGLQYGINGTCCANPVLLFSCMPSQRPAPLIHFGLAGPAIPGGHQ